MEIVCFSLFTVIRNKQVAADKKQRSNNEVKPVGEIKLGEVFCPCQAFRKNSIQYPDNDIQYQKYPATSAYSC